jgi:hypothetical protein
MVRSCSPSHFFQPQRTPALEICVRCSIRWPVFAAEGYGHGSALEADSTFLELLDARLATRSSAISRRKAAAAFHYAKTLL